MTEDSDVDGDWGEVSIERIRQIIKSQTLPEITDRQAKAINTTIACDGDMTRIH